jgi:hypothetical protein
MKKALHNLTELKNKLTPEEMHLVQDLLSDQDAEWQKKLRNIPVLAPLLGAFGLVSTFYGFEKLLDQTFLVEVPWLLLAMGIGTLLFTGVFYRKL